MYKKKFPTLISSILLSALFILVACSEPNDTLINKANEEWILGHNYSALELLNEVLKKNPSGPKAEEALFRLGEIHHFSLDNSTQALNYFQKVQQMNRQGPFSYDAQKYIAEIAEFGLKDYDQAIIEYQNLINFYGKEHSDSDHQYRIASIYYKKENYEQTLVELQILLDNYPKSPWAEEAKYKIVEVLYALNRCPEARKQYRNFNLEYFKSRFKSEMDFVVASCFEEEGHLQEAYNRFKALQEQYTFPSILEMKILGIKKRIERKR